MIKKILDVLARAIEIIIGIILILMVVVSMMTYEDNAEAKAISNMLDETRIPSGKTVLGQK